LSRAAPALIPINSSHSKSEREGSVQGRRGGREKGREARGREKGRGEKGKGGKGREKGEGHPDLHLSFVPPALLSLPQKKFKFF
jgi:hypothetical protein